MVCAPPTIRIVLGCALCAIAWLSHQRHTTTEFMVSTGQVGHLVFLLLHTCVHCVIWLPFAPRLEGDRCAQMGG